MLTKAQVTCKCTEQCSATYKNEKKLNSARTPAKIVGRLSVAAVWAGLSQKTVVAFVCGNSATIEEKMLVRDKMSRVW